MQFLETRIGSGIDFCNALKFALGRLYFAELRPQEAVLKMVLCLKP